MCNASILCAYPSNQKQTDPLQERDGLLSVGESDDTLWEVNEATIRKRETRSVWLGYPVLLMDCPLDLRRKYEEHFEA